MAKSPKSAIDTELLSKVVAATDSGQLVYLSHAEGGAFVAHNPPLIEVNTAILDPNDNTKAAARSTQAAKDYLAAQSAPKSNGAAEPSKYEIITNATLPEARKRGNVAGAGAPTKYPFADMPVGASFFSADSEHKNSNALKALGSTVSSQNRKYATPDGDKTKTIKQAKRGEDKKPVLDENGKKVIETKTIPVLKYERKFTIRPVVAGQKYGEWTAPANGALIARTL